MTSSTKNRIIGYIRMHKQARVYDLARALNVSRVVIHRHLKSLIEKGELRKLGKPPLVFYILQDRKPIKAALSIPEEIKKVIDDKYLYISPVGEMLYGLEGFNRWATEIKEEKRISDLAKEYVKTISDARQYVTSNGWIDATEKIKNSFEIVYIDKLLYGDFYTLPKFGKTKLGRLMLYAKQSQNRSLVGEIAKLVKPVVEKVIKKYKINAIVFIPPTVPRQIQFMDEFEKNLNFQLPTIDLVKSSSGRVIVPQKTLARLEERIINARETIFPRNTEFSYPNILLLDDAAGSGATFNETARKIRDIMVGKVQIIAFATVGSIKGFEVIREV